MYDILKTALYEFPVLDVEVNVPEWIHILDSNHEIKTHYIEKIKESVTNIVKLKELKQLLIIIKIVNILIKLIYLMLIQLQV